MHLTKSHEQCTNQTHRSPCPDPATNSTMQTSSTSSSTLSSSMDNTNTAPFRSMLMSSLERDQTRPYVTNTITTTTTKATVTDMDPQPPMMICGAIAETTTAAPTTTGCTSSKLQHDEQPVHSPSTAAAWSSFPLPIPLLPMFYPIENSHVTIPIPITSGLLDHKQQALNETVWDLSQKLQICFRQLSLQTSYWTKPTVTAFCTSFDQVHLVINLWYQPANSSDNNIHSYKGTKQQQQQQQDSILVEVQRVKGDSISGCRYIRCILDTAISSSSTSTTKSILVGTSDRTSGCDGPHLLPDKMESLWLQLPPLASTFDEVAAIGEAVEMVYSHMICDRCDARQLALESLLILTHPNKTGQKAARAIAQCCLLGRMDVLLQDRCINNNENENNNNKMNKTRHPSESPYHMCHSIQQQLLSLVMMGRWLDESPVFDEDNDDDEEYDYDHLATHPSHDLLCYDPHVSESLFGWGVVTPSLLGNGGDVYDDHVHLGGHNTMSSYSSSSSNRRRSSSSRSNSSRSSSSSNNRYMSSDRFLALSIMAQAVGLLSSTELHQLIQASERFSSSSSSSSSSLVDYLRDILVHAEQYMHEAAMAATILTVLMRQIPITTTNNNNARSTACSSSCTRSSSSSRMRRNKNKNNNVVDAAVHFELMQIAAQAQQIGCLYHDALCHASTELYQTLDLVC